MDLETQGSTPSTERQRNCSKLELVMSMTSVSPYWTRYLGFFHFFVSVVLAAVEHVERQAGKKSSG